MIALLNNCLVAKTSRAIFIHPHCLYSDVTTTLNQLPVQEIPGPVETKPLWEFDQTLSQRSDWVKGLARETNQTVPLHEVAHQGKQLQSQKPDGHAHTKNAIMLRACTQPPGKCARPYPM